MRVKWNYVKKGIILYDVGNWSNVTGKEGIAG